MNSDVLDGTFAASFVYILRRSDLFSSDSIDHNFIMLYEAEEDKRNICVLYNYGSKECLSLLLSACTKQTSPLG